MRRMKWVFLGLAVAITAGVFAQGGGVPSLLRLRGLCIGLPCTPVADTLTVPAGSIADAALTSNVALYNADMADFVSGTLADARLSSNAALYNADMANFVSGTLADARLSSNVPFLDAVNTFSTDQVIANTGPVLHWIQTDAAADNRRWRSYAVSAQWRLCAINDAQTDEDCLTLTRDGGSLDGIYFEGVDMTPTTGTFNLSMSIGCTTPPEYVFDWSRIGNIVVQRMVSSPTCTGNSSNFTSSTNAIPAALWPATTVNVPVYAFQDNGTTRAGCIEVSDIGRVRLFISDDAGQECSSAGWTASGTRGGSTQDGNVFTYMLGNP
jgi:hypothetical protein